MSDASGNNFSKDVAGGFGTLASAGAWRPDELGAMLEHQLSAPLAVDLFDRLPPAESQRLAALAAGASPPIVTFQDLLLHPNPPAGLLTLVHAFARRSPGARGGGLPQDVSRALDAAVSAAQALHGDNTLSSAAATNVAWLAELPWADASLRKLAAAASATTITVEPTPGGSQSSGAAPRAAAGASATSPAVVPFAPTIDGYEITGPLGEGGMGVVWRAVQLSTGRPVALKVMSAATFGSERARLRFEREVRLTARLDHPQIAVVYESGLHRGAYYYAMELIEGTPLDRYAREHKLREREILELVRSACLAVDHAHRQGIVHRDLKPGNILVDAAGVPHVLDFGLAKALQDVQTETTVTLDGDLTGTPAYMAPEQVAGHASACDARTDAYAMGVVLFYLLSGSFPHDPTGPRLEVFRRIGEAEPRRISEFRPECSTALASLVDRALARRLDERFSSTGELAVAIDGYLSGRLGTLKLPAKRGTRSLRRWAIAGAVTLLVLAVAARLLQKPHGSDDSPIAAPGDVATAPAAPIDGGPWIGGRIYRNPGQRHVLRLNRGRLNTVVQTWRIDWGAGTPIEEVAGSATTADHVYSVAGRFKVRAQAKVDGVWREASTTSQPIYRWPVFQGGNGHAYMLTNTRGSWPDLLDECWTRGGSLVSIESQAEQDFLNSVILSDDRTARAEWFWIGLTERPMHRLKTGNNDYIWTDGAKPTYINWAPGRPADPAVGNSAAMNYAYVQKEPGAMPGQWTDLNDLTATQMHGIAEFPPDPPNELLVVVQEGFSVPPEERP